MDQCGTVDKILELAERHLGVLGKGVGWIGCTTPFQLMLTRPFQESLRERPPGGLCPRLLGRIYVGQGFGVDLRPHGNLGIHLLHELAEHIGHIVELLVAGILEENLGCFVQAEPQPGVPAPLQYPLVNGQDQGGTLRGSFDLNKFARLDIHRIVHQDSSYRFNAWVWHVLLLWSKWLDYNIDGYPRQS